MNDPTSEHPHWDQDPKPSDFGTPCDHRWVGGGLRSDFICDECGARRDIESCDLRSDIEAQPSEEEMRARSLPLSHGALFGFYG